MSAEKPLCLSRAEVEDIATIRALETEAFGFTWDRETFLKELSRENGVPVVAKIGEEIVGAALLVWAAGEAQLNSIVLAPSVRGRGLSRPFLGSLMAWCREQGLRWLTLEVKWDNPPAHALYRKFGFVTTARRPRYYRDGQDARLMWAGDLRSEHFGALLGSYESPDFQLRRVS